tara:strand:- start:813 stop:2186 length:1374 start_codon:yes stop_codon:yes gene_type:complete
MRLFNSLSGKKEELVLSNNRKISIYVCGMTVYDDCHIGHARTFLSFDMVVRYLRFKEVKVNYVRNITDVDDKILARANENKEEPNILTTRYIERMTSDFNALGMITPDKEPKATENIGIIIDLINKLVESGNAYHEGGDVYFSIDSFSDYGKLSNQKMDEILLGNRIEIDENKKNPADFVLWKKEDQGLVWDSPWGEGRPGWHVECSAMSMDALGETFDIHAGGADLKFPHHENEIAQSESATGKKFANYWMHTGPLRIDKEKMSKSLDNFVTIREALKGYSPEIVRYFLLSSHYRSPINYSESGLKESKASLERLYNSINGLDFQMLEINLHSSHFKKFVKAMDDDFNVPEALAVLFDLAKVINKNKEDGNEDEASLLAGELVAMSEPLGLLQQDPQSFLKSGVNMDELEINKLIKEREDAREGKDYSKGDKIRDYLFEQNIILEDSKEGTFWRRR